MPTRAARAVAWLVRAQRRRRIRGAGVAAGPVWNAVRAGGRRMVGHVWGVARQLTLQIVGVTFLFFAAGFAYHGLMQWRRFEHQGGPHSLALTETVLAVLFAYFGISSFFRAGASAGK